MKYLKKFNESVDIYNGLTKEDFDDFFVDITDDRWDIRTQFKKELCRGTGPIPMGAKFKIVPVIYVYLKKDHIEPTNAAKANNYLKRYLENDKLFREVIDVTNNRLGDYGFYIHDISIVNNNEITILIYKI